MPLPETPRILIARMSAIGDTILTMPVLCAVRRKFPTAFIAWIVEAGAAPLLQGHECLDELIVLPRCWFKSPRRVWQLRRDLRSLRFDMTIDCQSITKTALACRLSGAPLRIGAAEKHGKELSPWMNNHRVPLVATHLVDRTLEMLAPLGITSPEVEFRLPADAQAEATIAEHRRQAGLTGRYTVINPGGSWDSKLWPAQRFARVARHLGDWHNLPSQVVWAGDRELDWARTIVAGSGGHARLAPATSLVELAALLRGASLFVGSDTGPLHLSVSVGTTSVGLYGTTRPADCGPYGPRNVALQQRYHSGNSRERRRANNDAMREITVDQVCQTCDRLLHRDTTDYPSSNDSIRSPKSPDLALQKQGPQAAPLNHGNLLTSISLSPKPSDTTMLIDPAHTVYQINALHAAKVNQWHETEVDNGYDGLLGVVCQQHQFNFLLWHEEDVARSPNVGDQRIAQVKRAIDGYNQQRNDWIERIDDNLVQQLAQQGIAPAGEARLNTETPGSAVDRLSIMSLRIYHMHEQLERDDATDEHRAKAQERLDRCYQQQHDLSQSLTELLEDIFAGRKMLKLYRQMKMYNDPTMNPYLYAGQQRKAG